MLVSEIGTRVKRQFGDEAGAQITDADILRWVNDAILDIASNNDLLQTKATASTTVDDQTYAVPADILRLQSVKYNGVALQSSTMQEFDEWAFKHDNGENAKGTPSHYWLFAGEVNLFPIPDEVGTLTLYYTRRPTVLTGQAETPDLPEEYHPRIVEYCIAQAYELDSDPQGHAAKMGQFKQGVSELKHNDAPNEFYPSITSLDEDD